MVRAGERSRGNVLVLSFFLVLLVTAFSAARFMSVDPGVRQAEFLLNHEDLVRFAENGINLALHQLSLGGDGNIGTGSWTPECDLGRDALAGTGDEGEGDGIPTPGEPNLASTTVGPAGRGIGLLVRTDATAWKGVKRITSSAFNATALATVEAHAGKKGSRYSILSWRSLR